jgi:hypothetical protein
MKGILIIVSLVIMSFTGGKEIPAAIKKSFIKLFPSAHNVKWDGDPRTHYEAGFIQDGKDNIAVFLPDGTFKEIETEIRAAEIPRRVLKAVSKKYPLSKISFALKIQRSNNTIVYDLEVNTGIEEIDITLDAMGFEVD